MTAPSSKDSLADAAMAAGTDVELHAALLARFKLSPEEIKAIYAVMPIESLSFAEAALRLGFVTQEQVDDALVWAKRRQTMDTSGLIETAIRRISENRQVVLAQGEKVKPGPRLILAHDPDNPRSEKIRALRTELLLLSEAGSGANTIALLSACAGEGRSQLAAELAIAFSQLGRRTLLVDADLRRPQQHLLFGSSNQNGLTEAIERRQKPWFHPVDGLPQLSLLTSGTAPPNPLELLSDGRFSRILQDWRKTFEFVVLDTPPIKEFADGLAIATLAGRVIVLGRGQRSSFVETRELLRRLSSTQSQILGAVINHF
ncbi:MAG TPA: CpsD/CapB family tyrosine-protein kinase [Steroidobacteraceae bacterium]|nr:CpsD/CapB family tyrosine-protein kinase [Steroidobacteraceae bacterium]